MKIGTAMLTIIVRKLRTSTVRSARKSDPNMRPSGGRVVESVVLVTDVAPRQSDEYVLEGHLAARYRNDAWILLVLLDEIVRGVDSLQHAMVDDGDPVAHGLRFFHR